LEKEICSLVGKIFQTIFPQKKALSDDLNYASKETSNKQWKEGKGKRV
jgi:hypothetical protein